MGFVEAIRSGFAQYVNPRGRASRLEFWWFSLFAFLAIYATDILMLFGVSITTSLYGVHAAIAMLGLALPLIMLQIRRLHDVNQSGWWTLLILIPFLGWLVLFIFNVQPGK